MARYRKVEVKTWGDSSFKNLSPIPPCGQGLWFYLMTGPKTTAIPGLFSAGPASMAEDLDWEMEAFREAFREALNEGMVKADFRAKLVFLPKAIMYNKPESPNVVRSWANEFEILPECDLKIEAYETLKAFICGMSEAYKKAFLESFRKPSFKASPNPSPKACLKAIANQEQEQEQYLTTTTGGTEIFENLADQSPSENTHRVYSWEPRKETLKEFERYKIPQDYIEYRLAEFRAYWAGREEKATGYDAKFMSQTISGWRKHSKTWNGDPTEPTDYEALVDFSQYSQGGES